MTEAVGTFTYPIEIAATPAGPFIRLDALVDTGAFYTWIPRNILGRLGAQAEDRMRFRVADGRVIERDIAHVAVRLDGRMRHTIAIFGDEGSRPLLGAVTLEEFAVTPDPVNQRLVSIDVLDMARV